MKYCTNCGNRVDDNAAFCGVCASPVQSVNPSDDALLKRLGTGLKHERLAYKIYGIVCLTLAGLLLIIGAFTAVLSYNIVASDTLNIDDYITDDYVLEFDGEEWVLDRTESAEVFAAMFIVVYSVFFIFMTVVFAAIGIVNIVMCSKLKKYRAALSTDCSKGIRHASSVGSIVFAAFFNTVALVFVIINFVFMKNNSAAFERLAAGK